MLDAKVFKKMSTTKRYEYLREHGTHLASRYYADFNVHLIYCAPHYVEVWYKLGYDMIYWVELVKNKETLNSYADLVNIEKDLKLNK